MESKATKYSVAATIILAASLVLLNPFDFSGGRRNVVLGEVAQKLSEARTVVHKEKRVAWRLGEDKPFFHAEVVKYASSDIGIVEEQYDPNGILMHRIYFLKERQQAILVFPATKKYITLPARGGIYEELARMTTPAGLVDYIMSRQYTKLGRARFDGFEAEGFETSDFDLAPLPEQMKFFFPIKSLTGRLWVDVDTSFPVGIEMEIDAGRGLLNGFQNVHCEFTAYDFRWNAELPAGILDPNIPADYTPIDLGSSGPEDAAWLGVGAVPVAGFVIHRRRSRQAGLGKVSIAG